MNLQDQGYRFYYLGGNVYQWVHPLEVSKTAIDCTDLDDDEFLDFMLARLAEEKQ